jgi:hypothetical protein
MQLVRGTCITQLYLWDVHIQVLDMILLPESAKPASSNTEVADIDMSRCLHQERTNMIKQNYYVKVANAVTL